MKNLALGTIIFLLVLFPITAIWHVAIFPELYAELGYFKEQETVGAAIAGLLNIVVQGFLLSVLFVRTQFFGAGPVAGIKFAGLVGVFYFTIQVVNFVVRKEISDIPTFILLEAAYMVIQFAIYGYLLGLLLKPAKPTQKAV